MKIRVLVVCSLFLGIMLVGLYNRRTLAPSNKAPVYYFAYGSNLSTERLQDRIGAAPSLGPALLNGYRFAFNKKSLDGTGKANIIRDRSASVQGLLYQVTEEQLKKLDYFEGAPDHYARKLVSVTDSGGKRIQAIVYIAQKRFLSAAPLQPSDEYLDHILRGAREHRLNPATIRHITEQSSLK